MVHGGLAGSLGGGAGRWFGERLRSGSGAHSCQTADLTKVVGVEQCYVGVDGLDIRGTDGPLVAMCGEAGEMAREGNECDGSGFARTAIGDARVKILLIKQSRRRCWLGFQCGWVVSGTCVAALAAKRYIIVVGSAFEDFFLAKLRLRNSEKNERYIKELFLHVYFCFKCKIPVDDIQKRC